MVAGSPVFVLQGEPVLVAVWFAPGDSQTLAGRLFHESVDEGWVPNTDQPESKDDVTTVALNRGMRARFIMTRLIGDKPVVLFIQAEIPAPGEALGR